MNLDTFLDVVRINVGAKSAGWRETGPCGFPPKIECIWSWGDHAVSFLFTDEVFQNPPPISMMVEKVKAREKSI
jgi:hypothetical protein